MEMERIEVEHNKAVTAVFSLLNLIAIAALSGCIALLWVNNVEISGSVGQWIVIVATVLLSICTLWLVVLLICQIKKLGRKVIFIADENGICDYSRHIVLAPIAWNEIKRISYKEFLSDDISDLRHLKIELNDPNGYLKKLNILQKLSYLLALKHIEIHLFCGKAKIKEIAEKLVKNHRIFLSGGEL